MRAEQTKGGRGQAQTSLHKSWLGGTGKLSLTLPHKGIEPRVFGFEFWRSNHCRATSPIFPETIMADIVTVVITFKRQRLPMLVIPQHTHKILPHWFFFSSCVCELTLYQKYKWPRISCKKNCDFSSDVAFLTNKFMVMVFFCSGGGLTTGEDHPVLEKCGWESHAVWLGGQRLHHTQTAAACPWTPDYACLRRSFRTVSEGTSWFTLPTFWSLQCRCFRLPRSGCLYNWRIWRYRLRINILGHPVNAFMFIKPRSPVEHSLCFVLFIFLCSTLCFTRLFLYLLIGCIIETQTLELFQR